MKLSSGIAPIPALLKAGVNVGIGTDGAASNNKLDMLADTRQAALLAKVGSLNPTDVPAFTALQMATINGATLMARELKKQGVDYLFGIVGFPVTNAAPPAPPRASTAAT